MGAPKTNNCIGLAAETGYSKGIVSRKLNQGKSPDQIRTERKKYEARAQKSEPEESTTVADWDRIEFGEAQRRKEVALAKLREFELRLKEGEVLNAEQVRESVAGMVINTRAKLLVIGDELADKLAATSDPIACRELVDSRISDALEALSA